jgi:hypothetical protein
MDAVLQIPSAIDFASVDGSSWKRHWPQATIVDVLLLVDMLRPNLVDGSRTAELKWLVWPKEHAKLVPETGKLYPRR